MFCLLLASLATLCDSLATALGYYDASQLFGVDLAPWGPFRDRRWSLLGSLGPFLASLGPLLDLSWASPGPVRCLPIAFSETVHLLTALGAALGPYFLRIDDSSKLHLFDICWVPLRKPFFGVFLCTFLFSKAPKGARNKAPQTPENAMCGCNLQQFRPIACLPALMPLLAS